MNSYEFIAHVKTCYKKRKKLLKIAEISDKIVTRKKQFERLRRGFKLEIMKAEDEGMKQKLEKITDEDGNPNKARLKRLTFHGGFDLGFTNGKLLNSKRSAQEINEMIRDYHELFKVGKSLRAFSNELEMEPLFTKSDIIIRHSIITALKTVSGKYTSGMNTLMRELNYCIDQRLAQIEKYLQLEKGTDAENRVNSRRGATMAGCLDLNAKSLLKSRDAESTLGFSDGKSTQPSRNRPSFLNGSGCRSTFATNLDIFKVTRSDVEDSDYFEDSDNEMLFDMENMLKQSRKLLSKSSFELMSIGIPTQPGSNPKIESPQQARKKKRNTNHSFQEMGTKFSEDYDSPKKTKSRKASSKSHQAKKVERSTPDGKKKDDLQSVKGENNNPNSHKKVRNLGSINIEMIVGSSLLVEKGVSNNQNENSVWEDTEVTPFRLALQKIENKRSDSSKIARNPLKLRTPDKSKLKHSLTQKSDKKNKKDDLSPQIKLKNQPSLEMELEPKDFLAISESPELISGAKSPTKGAPQFFKTILEEGRTPNLVSRQLQSPRKKLELNWKKALKKIGKAFIQNQWNIELPKKITKENEDLKKEKKTDFNLLEDIERLTATDPGEYFKSNPTLLSKVNFVTVSDFDYVKTLGSGAYGKVYLVRKKATGDYFAMKVIGSDKELSHKYIKNLLNEREVFSVIKSEFCVNAVATFTYQSLVCFVMEYLPGRDLYEEVFERENLWFDSTSLRYYLAEIILGIEALHDNGIVHRDIKPANVLIDEDGHLKLTDFGLSEFRSKIGTPAEEEDGKIRIKGSAHYLAPEIVQGDSIGYEADWWALGIMAYLFINMEFPFDGETIEEVFDNIIKGEIDWSNIGENEEEGEMDPALADLIKKLLDPNPNTRIGHNGSQEIKAHPYFKTLYWDKALEKKLYMYPPEDVLDLKNLDGEGIDLEEYLNIFFDQILESKTTKTKANLPFSNRFELVRMDQFHRRNVKVRKEIKKKARELNQEEQQVTNVIQDYCKREELFFYRNFNNF